MSTASRPLTDFVVLPSSQALMPDCETQPKSVVMNFQERPLTVTASALRELDITKYQVTKFYNDQIANSGYDDQLQHIVEPTLKEFEGPGNLDTSGEHDKTAVARYMRIHPEMNNVLLSGRDPFTLNTHKLLRIMDHLLMVPNLSSIRFGTKMVAFYPPRFADPEVPALFGRIIASRKTPVIVGHFDHIGEISNEAIKNIHKLREVGVQFPNQSVLLSKVEDDPRVLADTFATCHSIGVRPYYLSQGRPVKTASHFQVPLRLGVEIVRGINQRPSGIQKTFRYIMSHYTGKIEILDLGNDNRLYMRYHQCKETTQIGKMFSRPYVEGACWLDDLQEN